MKPIAVSRKLPALDEAVLARLKHLDITDKIKSMSRNAIGHGAFSEVFRGSAALASRGVVNVAIKRLRFHLDSMDCKRGSSCHAAINRLFEMIRPSYSSKKSMCGQNFAIRTFCPCWDTLSTIETIQDFLCCYLNGWTTGPLGITSRGMSN